MADNLARKYRPQTFNDVEGQTNVKAILGNQLKTRQFKQAYLFCGGAGTGKTTTARIMANEINQGKGTPIEIDGASNNGVENVRVIIDNCRFKSMDSEYKIYIIDEVHMLSTGAFNALLKTLEEPPANTIFMLCTTDPQKIPATILSRVQRFDFKRLSMEEIVNRLQYIIRNEEYEIDPVAAEQGAPIIDVAEEALYYIAKIADGGMRDAITLLDTCLSYNHSLSLEDVVEILGAVNYDVFFELTTKIFNSEPGEALVLIEEQYINGKDLKQFVKNYSIFILDILKFKLLGNFEYLSIPETYGEQVLQLANMAEDSFYQEILKTFNELVGKIKWESNVKPMIEAEVLLLCL